MRVTTPDQQNWIAKLLGYNFEIQYKPGRENRTADALSRRADSDVFFQLISSPIWLQGAQLVEEAKQDSTLQQLTQKILLNPSKFPGYSIQHDLETGAGEALVPASILATKSLREGPDSVLQDKSTVTKSSGSWKVDLPLTNSNSKEKLVSSSLGIDQHVMEDNRDEVNNSSL
ncbi:hypothetical protein E3N88_15877 [Mikania micrantha]|uniref:Reverse transcriptase RNase H-like domain-containing protein n=1 Tax=Mikania micrantha TaxID=192012 RepID=A0A5N6NY08_9ASTR|nr:hypothetical protein E3N88_15877 [Mikania micrantha]